MTILYQDLIWAPLNRARSDYSRSTPSLVEDDLRYVKSVETNVPLGIPIGAIIEVKAIVLYDFRAIQYKGGSPNDMAGNDLRAVLQDEKILLVPAPPLTSDIPKPSPRLTRSGCHKLPPHPMLRALMYSKDICWTRTKRRLLIALIYHFRERFGYLS